MNRQQRKFDRQRLELFERRGVEMERRWSEDDRDRRTCVLDSGGDDPPLLMIHGGGSQAAEWAPIAGRFVDRRRLLAVDRPGCGLSYSMDYRGIDVRESAADWMASLVDDLELEEVDVMANWMGAYFAFAYLLSDRHDHRVRRLVLAGAPAGVDRWVPYTVRSMAIPGLNRLVFALAGRPDARMMRAYYRRLLVTDPERLSDAYLDVMAAGANLPGAEAGWRSLLENLLDVGGFRRDQMVRESVAELEVPTLFCWGEKDTFAPTHSGSELADAMPVAEFVRLPKAGNLVWLDEPDRVARSVGEFLQAPAPEPERVVPTPRPEASGPRPGPKPRGTAGE